MHLLHHAAELAQRLVELTRVLNKGLRAAQREGAGRHLERAEHRDDHVGQVGNELHDRHHHARQELRQRRGAEQLLVALVKVFRHGIDAAEDGGEVVAGESLFDLAVEVTGRFPLRLELFLRAGTNDRNHDGGQRQREQRYEGQLPGHGEHHDRNAHDHEQVIKQLRDGLLEGGLDIVGVVGRAREQVTARLRIEVIERQAVELGLDISAQVEDHLHHQGVEQKALPPLEERGHHVHRDDNEDDGAELGEINAEAGVQVHSGGHVGKLVLPARAERLDGLLFRHPRRHVARNNAGENDVGGHTHDLRRGHSQQHAHDIHGGNRTKLHLERRKQPKEALRRGPEVLGPARSVLAGLLLELSVFTQRSLVLLSHLCHLRGLLGFHNLAVGR